MAEIGHFADADGEERTVAVYGENVCVEGDQACLLSLGPAEREVFSRLYFEAARQAEGIEPPRTETDCACPGDDCPCEAAGADGLCRCCRSGEHNGSCGAPGPAAGEQR